MSVCVCVCVCVMNSISFQTFFFLQAFKIVVDSSKFSILLLYIFMISSLNEQVQQQLEYTLHLIVTAGEFHKCNLDMGTL